MTTVYVVIIEDRHSGVGVEVHDNPVTAMQRACELAQQYKHKDDPPVESQLNSYMKEGGWLCYYSYSCEGDSTRVVKTELVIGPVAQG